MQIYKDSGNLIPITEAYDAIRDGRRLSFIDADGQKVKVFSIKKEQYSGKIYDVDVSTDIVLVKRENSSAFWSGNSNLKVYDYTGRNNGTSYGNATQVADGKLGKAFSFDGNGDYVNIATSSSLDGLGSNLSLSMWTYTGEVETAIPNSYRGLFDFEKSSTDKITCFKTVNSGSIECSNDIADVGSWLTFTGCTYDDLAWIHLSFIFNETNLSIYKNGVLCATKGLVANFSRLADGFVFNWGYYAGGTADRMWNGTFDEVMIFNRSLSAEEIRGLYANQSTRYLTNNFTGLADGNHSFTAYVQDLAGNVVSARRDITVDTAYPGVVLTNQTTNQTFHNSNTITVNVSASDSNSLYTFIDFDSSLVGWWRMDETNQSMYTTGAKVIDSSSYGNNGTAYGNASQVSNGKFGKGFGFDGDGDYVDVGNNAIFDIVDTGNKTFSMWVYPNGLSGSQGLLSRADASLTDTTGYIIYFNGAVLTIRYNNGTSVSASSSSTATFINNQWQYISLVVNKDNEQVTFYRNGGDNNTVSLSKDGSWAKSVIATIGSLTSAYWYFNGTIDDVIIFNPSLSS